MAECNEKDIQKPGSSNPIQSKIVENNHGSSTTPPGDNTLIDVTCNSSVAVGDVVRLSGSTYIKGQANTSTNSNIVGICTSKTSSTICNILVTGPSGDVFSGLTAGLRYFLDASTSGAITTTIPTGSGEVVTFIGVAYSSQALIFNPQIRLVRD